VGVVVEDRQPGGLPPQLRPADAGRVGIAQTGAEVLLEPVRQLLDAGSDRWRAGVGDPGQEKWFNVDALRSVTYCC
jgi:hypothetical protein